MEPSPGIKIGKWNVLYPAKISRGVISLWKCRCDCGTEREVPSCILRRGKSNSCGCLRREFMSSGKNQRSHGMTKSQEFRIWSGIKQRCLNPNASGYSRYGGAGITICDEWIDSFEKFYQHIGPRPSRLHSIDRFPNMTGNYEPGNVRWATSKEQASNRKTTRRKSE